MTPSGDTWDGADISPGSSSGTLNAPVYLPGRWSVVVDPTGDATGIATVRFTMSDA